MRFRLGDLAALVPAGLRGNLRPAWMTGVIQPVFPAASVWRKCLPGTVAGAIPLRASQAARCPVDDPLVTDPWLSLLVCQRCSILNGMHRRLAEPQRRLGSTTRQPGEDRSC